MQQVCPLSSFSRIGDGKTLQVRLENSPSCHVFTGISNEIPMLFLVNNIKFEESVLVGNKISSWNGDAIDNTRVRLAVKTDPV